MRVAIVGAGVAGSYLSYMLSNEYNVEVFEKYKKENFDSVCAWGASEKPLRVFAKNCGLNFEDYVLFKGKELTLTLNRKELRVKLKGLCTFDKIRLLKDLVKGLNVNYGKFVNTTSNFDDYDFVIDATGVSRALLPKLNKDLLIPCVLYKVKFKEMPYDDFYVKIFHGLTGYFWFFPLGNNLAHVGAGDFKGKHIQAINNFLKGKNYEILKRVGKPVRILPPSLCKPFHFKNIVGVGECIGTIFPMVGEGIIPSLQASEIFLKSFPNLRLYERRILRKFKAYNFAFKFIKSKLDNAYSFSSNIFNIIMIFLHLRLNQDRYGFKLTLSDTVNFLTKS